MKARRRGRPKGSKTGAGAEQPQPFEFVAARGRVSVRVGSKRCYGSADEAIVSAAPVRITVVDGALLVRGEGVVRRHKTTIAVTA